MCLIQRIVRRLAEIEAEVAELTSSEIALLVARVDTETTRGRNLLAEMAHAVRRRIESARKEYEVQSSKVAAR
jgi:hypothetical protein